MRGEAAAFAVEQGRRVVHLGFEPFAIGLQEYDGGALCHGGYRPVGAVVDKLGSRNGTVVVGVDHGHYVVGTGIRIGLLQVDGQRFFRIADGRVANLVVIGRLQHGYFDSIGRVGHPGASVEAVNGRSVRRYGGTGAEGACHAGGVVAGHSIHGNLVYRTIAERFVDSEVGQVGIHADLKGRRHDVRIGLMVNTAYITAGLPATVSVVQPPNITEASQIDIISGESAAVGQGIGEIDVLVNLVGSIRTERVGGGSVICVNKIVQLHALSFFYVRDGKEVGTSGCFNRPVKAAFTNGVGHVEAVVVATHVQVFANGIFQ